MRDCARPPFALERLRELDGEHLLYESTKPGPGATGLLVLTPLELINRIATRVPPPRIHRHRYFGVLAPNSPLRAAVTALAVAATTPPPAPPPNPPAAEPAHRRAARYAWALRYLGRLYLAHRSTTQPRETTMNILQINSSARSEASHSTRLASALVERVRVANP